MVHRTFALASAILTLSCVASSVHAEGVLPVNYRPQYPYVSVYSYRNMQLWPELAGMYAPGARTPYNIGVQGGYSSGTHYWSAAFAPYGAQNHLQRTYVSAENPRNTQTTVEPRFTYAQGGANVGTAPWEMNRSGLSLRSATTGTRTSGLRSAAGTMGASRFSVSSGGTSGFSGGSRTTGSSFTFGSGGGSGFSFGSGNNSTGTSGGSGRFGTIGSLGQGNGGAVGFGNGDRSRGEAIFGPLPTYEQLFGS